MIYAAAILVISRNPHHTTPHHTTPHHTTPHHTTPHHTTKRDHRYGFGKAVAKVARHALIAEELGKTALYDEAVGAIELALTPWLEVR